MSIGGSGILVVAANSQLLIEVFSGFILHSYKLGNVIFNESSQ